jgi:hypothetical protein
MYNYDMGKLHKEVVPRKEKEIPSHGTAGMYSNHKCRCDSCKSAWAKQMKMYRSRYEEARKRHRARSKLQAAIKRGEIVPSPCRMCSNKEVQAHHDDYDYPLIVKWFCRSHHNEWHNAI